MKNTDAILNALLTAAILGGDKKTTPPKPDGDEIQKTAEDMGNIYYCVYLGFKDAGFTSERAFELLLETIRRN